MGHGLSRAAYAKLYSAGFPPVLDRHGEHPEVIDPQTSVVVNLHKEEQDPLQCNEIVFQFLAFSRIDNAGKAVTSGTVFFTLQFYRCPQLTTERLMLSKPHNDFSSDPLLMPYILQRLDKNGSVDSGSPGLEVRYYMDPAFMKPGENSMFLHHLSKQVLHIDVWDGDSLLRIGECAVELKYLCRCGHEAVQTTFELDVINMEYHDDVSIVDSGIQPGNVQPIGVTTINRGKLHFRMANIGHLVDPKLAITAPFTLPSKQKVIVSQTAGNSTYPGGALSTPFSTSAGGLVQKKNIARAHHLADHNREVAALLFSNKEQTIPEKDTSAAETEKNRKLARIQAVRQKEGMDNKFNTLLSTKTVQGERQRDLKTLEIYRLQTKKDGIMSMLSQTITTEHIIHPSFATSEFFEFVLKNPFNIQHTVTIEWEDNDLKVVTDTREWRHFKQLNQLQTPIEEGMFNKKAESHYPEIFMRPKETVNIPFKYLTFTADQSVEPQGPVDTFKKPDKEKEKNSEIYQEKIIKIFFKNEDGKPIAVLLLKVQPQPHIIDQTFRFHHPEQSFLKKSMRMPIFQSLPGAPVGGTGLTQAHVRCSDPNVICDSKAKQQGEPIDVNLKVALGPSPQIKRFFMAVFLDPFFSRPVQIWQFYVHALQRVDVNCTEGQTSRFSLLLRGTQASRLVRCFSSHPLEMQLHPSNQFMLAAGAVHELNVAVRPMKEGNKFFYLNVVDVEYHQLIRTWLVCVSCRAPVISRAFELILPIGGGKGSSKRITYTNPYPHKKMFSVLTNRDDLLQFKETKFDIEGGATYTIGLRFTPVLKMGSAEILVFINDEDDKNEETFQITATYQ
ncbi:hypothetical protein KUTeg_001397 [Tegillarca granosa]|uniref:Nephrocystin-4 n=1 Tax=Tegillarca granosa TaxID=220873 RepID=A0ABQ9FU68_TEGGR|nr:hypothetical protein KUTeg_001397 [Tegillarca granosa]